MNNAENSAPESEIRLIIHDIKSFKEFLRSKKVERIRRYKFTDRLYRPGRSDRGWTLKDLETKTMRLREWKEPDLKSQLLYSKVELIYEQGFRFKQSVFPGGKVNILVSDRQTIEEVLQDWNFQFWFEVEKEEGELLKISKENFILALEKIKDFGYTAEIEVHLENIPAIQESFKRNLAFFEEIKNTFQVTHRSLPSLVAESLGL